MSRGKKEFGTMTREQIFRELDKSIGKIDKDLLKEYLVARGYAEYVDDDNGGERDGKKGQGQQ